MKNEKKNWRIFWTEHRGVLIKKALKGAMAVPIAALVGGQISLGISCAAGNNRNCVWVGSLLSNFKPKTYLLLIFCMTVVACQTIFYYWQKYSRNDSS